jgi:hypothetical protein
MIGRLRLCARTFVYLAAIQPRGELRRQQEVIDSDSAVMLESLPEIIRGKHQGSQDGSGANFANARDGVFEMHS